MDRTRTGRALAALLLSAVLVSASGLLGRPHGGSWDLVYDLGLYNVVYLAGAALCWRARRSAPGLRALAVALTLNSCGNGLLVAGVAIVAGIRLDPPTGPKPTRLIVRAWTRADTIALAGAEKEHA